VFWRVGSSGSVSTLSKSNILCGDIVQVDFNYPEFPFSVECKFRKSFDLIDLLFQKKKSSQIVSWLEQCMRDSERAKKEPLLVIKRNFYPELFILKKKNLKIIPTSEFIEFLYNKERFLVLKIEDFNSLKMEDLSENLLVK
jgi:hypothetical protein